MRKLGLLIGVGLLAIQLTACGGNKKEYSKEVQTTREEVKAESEELEIQAAESESEPESEPVGNIKEASIIYIKDKEIDLTTWKEKSLSEIVEELGSTGVVFNRIDGTNTIYDNDKSYDTETVKKSLEDISNGNSWSVWFGDSSTNRVFHLEYFGNSETLGLDADTNMDEANIFALSRNKYTSKDILGAGHIDSFFENTNLFDENSYGALECEDYENGLDAQLAANHHYKFQISDYK